MGFLLSSPRAGSTLLSVILNRHSEILCPSEPWFLLSLHALYHDTVTGIAAHDPRLAGIGLREFAGEEEFLGAARAFALSLYGARLRATGRSLFIDKTPRYYHILPFLAALFPASRMMWLKRSPLDVAASYKETWGVPVAELVGRDLSPNSFDLTLGLLNLGAWFDRSPGRLEFSYEELVAKPDHMVARVLELFGLKTESGLVEYGADAESMSGFHRSSLGDKKVFEHSRPHGRSVGRWRDTFSPAELAELITGIGTDTFVRMGYEEDLAEASRRAAFSAGREHRPPRYLEKLRLHQRWFAAALPLEAMGSGQAPQDGSGTLSDARTVRLALLEARLAAELDSLRRKTLLGRLQSFWSRAANRT